MARDPDPRRGQAPPWAEWSNVQEVTDWVASPGDPAWLAPGQDVDRFEVEARVGQGAHAVVYRVRHSALGTRHALKVLRNADATVKRRLLQEGRIQAELRHPNVVAVTDVIELPPTLGLLMDYVYGPPLDDWLRAQRPDIQQALDIFRPIVEGVRAAHRLGIVHRDIKPANVLMDWDGEGYTPRVTDFGLAKVERAQVAMGSAQALGTPAYMAPEQIRDAARVDPRADIFSLGCVLYELLCGVRPYRTLEIPVLFNEILNGRYPPPEKLNPELPEHLVLTIRRCLEVERWRRPPSCDVLLHMLEGFDEAASVDTSAGPRLDEGSSLQPGALLEGRYELVGKLGHGTSGEVWRALDRSTRQEVALKLLHRQLLDEPGRADAFLNSARRVAALRHRHVVRVLQPYGDHQGQIFFVMELLAGGDLAERLRAGPMKLDEVVGLIDALAGGLAAAHAKGLVHRNLKPRNVLFDEGGRVVLSDFDLALPGEEDAPERRVDDMDTFLFAAPERTRNPQRPGRRADQYSLAMVAACALNRGALTVGAVYDTRAFLQQLDAPNRVKRALARSLSVDPALRYDDVLGLAAALRAAAASRATRVGASTELAEAELRHLEGRPLPEPRPRPRWLPGLGLVSLGLLAGLAASRLAEGWLPSEPEAVQAPAVEAVAIEAVEAVEAAPAPAPEPPAPEEAVLLPPAPVEPERTRFTVSLAFADGRTRATLRCPDLPVRPFQGSLRQGFPRPTSCVVEAGSAYGTVNISREEEILCEVLDTTVSCSPR